MTILQERGRFWWHDEPVPAGHFAPDASITGLFTIDSSGRTTLELDGVLPGKAGPFEHVLTQGLLIPEKYIQGILTSTGQHILLADIMDNGGGFHTPGPWRQNYLAFNCLVGPQPFLTAKIPAIQSMIIELNGNEDWLQLRSMEVRRKKNTMSTKYKRPKGATYRLKSDTLKFEFGLTGPYGFIKHREISFREHASLVYSTRQPRQLDDQREIYGLLEDLFILLTGSELILNWPKVSLQGNSAEYNWYFWRDGSPTSTPINFREFWTNFPQLKKDFGSIWTKWRSLRDYTGPGVYLYLGTRRGMRMYTEHRFVNLIWGIEAFHRKRDQAEPSDAFLKKLERIVSQVKDPKDATWLRGKLRHAHDPSLANRITSVIKSLPIGLDPSLVVRFADECATKRNDISHFGGAKDGVSYNEFIKRLDQLSDALTTLYHYLLLHEIGVSADVLNRQIYDGLRSHAIKRNFVDVGLLKQVPKKVDCSNSTQ